VHLFQLRLQLQPTNNTVLRILMCSGFTRVGVTGGAETEGVSPIFF